MRNCLQVFLLDWRTDKANDNFKKINRMKKFITLMILSALCLGAKAQQINGDFDGTWENCIPWDSNGNAKKAGTQPPGWTVSNVVAYAVITAPTAIATKENHNDGSCVQLTNKDVWGSKVPAYISLGTTWATAKISGTSPVDGTADGGTFGGIDFEFKPDALSLSYKRSSISGERASVIAYMWKGEFVQKDVPGNTTKNTIVKTEMKNRDRQILGKLTDANLGGDTFPSLSNT